ncbi:hypothetical protein [Dactylosporangium sp. NPDC000521]|uniref:hypothetical protein n=1 Tax=Dactylosporangium sp. NPDC000521 TaxID=3363975 RepID=UPI00369B89E4
MRRSPLLGWILPAVITVAIAVSAGGVLTGRWDPNPGRADAGVVPKVDSTDPEMRKSQELCPFVDRATQIAERLLPTLPGWPG